MKNQRLAHELAIEIREFLDSRLSLSLAVNQADGSPLASYAPFAQIDNALYILVSELAQHTKALQISTMASVMIMDDEVNCDTVYARRRLQYEVAVTPVVRTSETWQSACETLERRHGDIVTQLMQLGDFHMFKLSPTFGRYVKGFGRAYELPQNVLVSEQLRHLQG